MNSYSQFPTLLSHWSTSLDILLEIVLAYKSKSIYIYFLPKANKSISYVSFPWPWLHSGIIRGNFPEHINQNILGKEPAISIFKNSSGDLTEHPDSRSTAHACFCSLLFISKLCLQRFYSTSAWEYSSLFSTGQMKYEGHLWASGRFYISLLKQCYPKKMLPRYIQTNSAAMNSLLFLSFCTTHIWKLYDIYTHSIKSYKGRFWIKEHLWFC